MLKINDSTLCIQHKQPGLWSRGGSYHGGESHVAAVDPGQSKVSQLHLALAGYQNILWFQVSVQHTVRVQECKAAQQLPHEVLQKHTQEYFNRKQIFKTEVAFKTPKNEKLVNPYIFCSL